MPSHPKLDRGLVWCRTCERVENVNARALIWFNNGGDWPKCHSETMTLDSPEERAEFDAQRMEKQKAQR